MSPTDATLVITQQGDTTALASYVAISVSADALDKIVELGGIEDAWLPCSSNLSISRHPSVEWDADLEDAVMAILMEDMGRPIFLVEAGIFNIYNRDPHIISVYVGHSGVVELTRHGYEPGASRYDRELLETLASALSELRTVRYCSRMLPGSLHIHLRHDARWKWNQRVRDEVQATLERIVGRRVVFVDVI